MYTVEIHTRSTIKLWNSTKVLVEFQSCGVEIHAVDLHMYSTYEFVDLQFSCGIGVEHWISTCGLCNQGLEPHLESGFPHSPFVTPSPLVHFFIFLPYVHVHVPPDLFMYMYIHMQYTRGCDDLFCSLNPSESLVPRLSHVHM